MNAKTTIRKVLFIALWLCIGGGMVSLLLAAISRKNKGLCSDYSITIKGVQNNFFIDEKDVKDMLVKAMGGKIKGQSIESFNLHQLEEMLEKDTWISKAELYFDNQDVLHVMVIEKEPIARVFTTANSSFYIDSAGQKMPLSDKLSARVPVFTGFPDKKKLTANDSLLLNDVKRTANFIVNDPFWMSQVAQIDIAEDGSFEMVPVVGDHLVKLGNGDDIAAKFNRLMVFYKQVMRKTGFDKYKVIDIQYKGQVVTSKQVGTTKVDSVQLRRNVERLLRLSREAENDTVVRYLPVVDRTLAPDNDSVAAAPASANSANMMQDANSNNALNPVPVKPSVAQKPATGKPANKQVTVKQDKPKQEKPKQDKPKQDKPKPKAVMPKTPAEDANSGYN